MDFEKYSLIHDELMKKLEDGEITTEQVKELDNLMFDKFILEKSDKNNIERFRDILMKNGITVTIRRELGSDIENVSIFKL